MVKTHLEKYKLFPYIAWALCIAFAMFVYHLALNLKEAKSDLAIAQKNLEQNTKIDPQMIPLENLKYKSDKVNKLK